MNKHPNYSTNKRHLTKQNKKNKTFADRTAVYSAGKLHNVTRNHCIGMVRCKTTELKTSICLYKNLSLIFDKRN